MTATKVLLPPFLVLAAAAPAFAGPGEDKQVALTFLACVTVVPLALFPLGLAFHLLLRAVAPRRVAQLVLAVEAGGWRTLALGVLNALVLLLVFLAAARRVDVVALFSLLVFLGLAFVGSHGVARSLGGRVLGRDGGPRAEVRELALGWFVLCYVGCFPLLGWIFALGCAVRGIGSIALSLLAPEPDAPAGPA